MAGRKAGAGRTEADRAADARRLGRPRLPNPITSKVTVRLRADELAALERLAAKHNASLSAAARAAIRAGTKATKREHFAD